MLAVQSTSVTCSSESYWYPSVELCQCSYHNPVPSHCRTLTQFPTTKIVVKVPGYGAGILHRLLVGPLQLHKEGVEEGCFPCPRHGVAGGALNVTVTY
jgi:hypothetical protein